MIFIMYFFNILFKDKSDMAMEILTLRQQLAVFKQSIKRPKLKFKDRLFWITVSRLWRKWIDVLIIVKPITVVRWHKKLFKYYWRLKCKPKGRPKISEEIRNLIKQMLHENPLWGAGKIFDELILLGYNISLPTVKNYLKYFGKRDKPPSGNWMTFLKNHLGCTCAIDFFVVPTINFRLLYGFIVLSHERRKIIHFNVTCNPNQNWLIQQIREAFPYNEKPKYLVRDRASIYCKKFREFIKDSNITDLKISYKSPWQNPYCERVIGSIRKELLNHVIIFNENHLRKLLKDYVSYYNNLRPHQSLNGNSPDFRKKTNQVIWKDYINTSFEWSSSLLQTSCLNKN